MPHVERQRVAVDLGVEGGVRRQRLQLGTEEEGPTRPAVIERLDPQPVAHQVQRPLLAVPEGEAEHADEAL